MAQRSSRSGKSETQSSGKEEELEVVDAEDTPSEKVDEPKSTTSVGNELEEVAQAVLRGEYGVGQERRLKLSEAGYNARDVEREVVRITNRM